MTTTQDPIAHAARLLREAAEELRQAHAFPGSEGWENETDAKAAYDEHMAAAQALEDWEAAVGAGGVQALSAAPATPTAGQPIGEVVVTKGEDGQIVAVTRQDDEGRILSVIATSDPAKQQTQPGAVYAELHEPDATTVGLGAVWNRHSMRDFADRTHALRKQATPKAAPGVGNSGFDHKTAADLLNNKTVSDEAVRKFVATSRWAHDEKAALSATLLAMHGVLTSREAEIALLKKALLEAEAAPQQEAQEPAPSAAVFGLRLVPVEPTDQMVQAAHHIDLSYMPGQEGADRAAIYRAMIAAAPQPAPAPLSEREAFERDWEKRHAPVPINGRTHDDGRYGDSSIQDAWESWQARAALAAQGGE